MSFTANLSRLSASLLALGFLAGCGGDESGATVNKSPASVRAVRRAYDGAPPVIPHEPFGATCTACHNERGLEVPDVGFAPAMPHGSTPGLSDASRCEQCHVFRETEDLFVASGFAGLPQAMQSGSRAYEGAPPRMPHRLFMHEDCLACHNGDAAREEIRTTHPERGNCKQCHVPLRAATSFSR